MSRDQISVAVRVKPGASRTRVGGRHGSALVIAVQERAVEGRATEAARLALAEALGVSKADVSLRSGATARDKLFTVHNAPSDLDERLERLRQADTPRSGNLPGKARVKRSGDGALPGKLRDLGGGQ